VSFARKPGNHPNSVVTAIARVNGENSQRNETVLGERDAAQAQALIQALCVARDKMISRMSRLEKYGAHRDAAALRRDISEAEAHITNMRRRYLGGDLAASQARSTGPLSGTG
jgi:hypothetical protein